VIFSIGYIPNMAGGAMSTALSADTAVYGEWKTGKSIQGFTMALLTLPIKVGILVRAEVIGIGFMVIGYVPNTVPSQIVVEGMGTIMYFAPAEASALGAIVFYLGYRIDDKHILQMQNEIAVR